MRPGTIHAVFTTEDAICRGGHFLATHTMSETLYGAIHCFFKGIVLTNIDHPTIQSRVNVIICYFYMALVLGLSDVGKHSLGICLCPYLYLKYPSNRLSS